MWLPYQQICRRYLSLVPPPPFTLVLKEEFTSPFSSTLLLCPSLPFPVLGVGGIETAISPGGGGGHWCTPLQYDQIIWIKNVSISHLVGKWLSCMEHCIEKWTFPFISMAAFNIFLRCLNMLEVSSYMSKSIPRRFLYPEIISCVWEVSIRFISPCELVFSIPCGPIKWMAHSGEDLLGLPHSFPDSSLIRRDRKGAFSHKETAAMEKLCLLNASLFCDSQRACGCLCQWWTGGRWLLDLFNHCMTYALPPCNWKGNLQCQS